VRLECAECHKHPFDQWTKYEVVGSFTTRFDGLGSAGERLQAMYSEPPAVGVDGRHFRPKRSEDLVEGYLRLPDEDLEALRTCRVGQCDVKLSEQALKRFQSEIDWRAPNPRPAADALMRQLAFEYVSRYLAGGNEQLAVDPEQKLLYVSNEDAGTATVTDIDTGEAVSVLITGIEPEGVAISPDGRWVYVMAETSSTVTVT
jgi:hypothetical protein